MALKDKKCLITYFSRKGNNYVSGKIKNLPIGNTEVMAKMIQKMTESDLFHIESVNSYPEDYTEATDLAKEELNNNERPELTDQVKNIDSYDVIFLGYPNWWGTMPMPVFTFLEAYDLSEKIIIPFCTHEGSGLGRSMRDIKNLCPDSKVFDGIAIWGSEIENSAKDISKWLNKNGII